MARRDHPDIDPESPDLVEFLQDLRRERDDQVRKELLRVGKRCILSELIVEPGGACEMLPEGVVREENGILGEVGEHRVGPVEHRRLKEGERLSPEIEGVAGLHDLDLPAADIVVAGKAGLRPFRAVDRDFGHLLHERGQGAGVVHLDVVHDDVVDRAGVADGPDAAEDLSLEPVVGAVDERRLLTPDEVGVVGRSREGVAVVLPQVPVDCPDPVDAGDEFCCHHRYPYIVRY